ncbi:MAG: DUF6671 family protein [Halieaceae bacterium]|jgi:hypothetical protein|nr:DUF6671 family protein [Halieaceae bacterium]
MFEGRRLLIATMHAKEQAIAPVLEAELGVSCTTPENLDTDLLGTFTGEIERTLDPVAAAREKCRRAMDATGLDLAVASEGSFGPHPVMVFVPGGEELLVLVDRADDLELVVRDVSAATNFATAELREESELQSFAEKAQFPGHALILRKARDSAEDIHKGIHDRGELLRVFRDLRSRYESVFVETDMRAKHNPTRMAAIGAAARKLAELAKSPCPQCGAPGFTITDVIRGLPCELCGLPTNGISRNVLSCGRCAYTEDVRHPNGKTAEDPMYCEFCNP